MDTVLFNHKTVTRAYIVVELCFEYKRIQKYARFILRRLILRQPHLFWNAHTFSRQKLVQRDRKSFFEAVFFKIGRPFVGQQF